MNGTDSTLDLGYPARAFERGPAFPREKTIFLIEALLHFPQGRTLGRFWLLQLFVRFCVKFFLALTTVSIGNLFPHQAEIRLFGAAKWSGT